MAMSDAQARHLQSLTTALMGVCDAIDRELDGMADLDQLSSEEARDIARRVLERESYDLAAEAVAAEWAASSGAAIPEPGLEVSVDERDVTFTEAGVAPPETMNA